VRTGHGRSDGETRLLLRVPYVPPTRARSLFSLSLLHSMSLPRTRGVRPAEATSDMRALMIRVDSARPRVAVRDTTRAPSLLDGPAWASHTPSPIATFGISLQSTGVPILVCAFALPRCPSTERRDHVAWAQPPCSQRALFASHSARERSEREHRSIGDPHRPAKLVRYRPMHSRGEPLHASVSLPCLHRAFPR
jgi:hypothetical protein